MALINAGRSRPVCVLNSNRCWVSYKRRVSIKCRGFEVRVLINTGEFYGSCVVCVVSMIATWRLFVVRHHHRHHTLNIAATAAAEPTTDMSITAVTDEDGDQ